MQKDLSLYLFAKEEALKNGPKLCLFRLSGRKLKVSYYRNYNLFSILSNLLITVII